MWSCWAPATPPGHFSDLFAAVSKRSCARVVNGVVNIAGVAVVQTAVNDGLISIFKKVSIPRHPGSGLFSIVVWAIQISAVEAKQLRGSWHSRYMLLQKKGHESWVIGPWRGRYWKVHWWLWSRGGWWWFSTGLYIRNLDIHRSWVLVRHLITFWDRFWIRSIRSRPQKPSFSPTSFHIFPHHGHSPGVGAAAGAALWPALLWQRCPQGRFNSNAWEVEWRQRRTMAAYSKGLFNVFYR